MRERQFVAGPVNSQDSSEMFEIKQTFPRPRIEPEDIPGIIRGYLSKGSFTTEVGPDMRIAITTGSRGVANMALVTKTITDYVKSRGAEPFVVPTMRSYGGATAEGQEDVLESYDITKSYLGCPILSSMEVKKVGVNEEGMDVFIDKYAAEMDDIIVSYRIKPHTAPKGPYEGGIMKMMTIGLGKQHGAEVCHEAGFKSMVKYVPVFGKAIIENAPVLLAVAVIENAFDETCEIAAVQAEDIAEREPSLLKEAFTYIPRILVDSCNVLVMDQIDKNFSGDGMDPNITGTFCTPYASGGINAQRVCILDLNPETHGNGIGLRYSGATTKRVFNQLDLASIYPNAITYTTLGGVRILIVMESGKEAIQVCVCTCNEIDKKNPRIVRTPNSLHLEHIMLSEACYDEVRNYPDITIESEPEYLPFDEDGNLW